MDDTDVGLAEPSGASDAQSAPSSAAPASARRWRLRGIRVFSSAADDIRLRRPTDVLLLVLSLVFLVPLAIAAPGDRKSVV